MRSAQQMTLMGECVECGGMDGEGTLAWPGRFEALVFSFAASYRLMRVLRPVVCSQAPIVLSREPDRAERCRIGSQPIGHTRLGAKPCFLSNFTMSFFAAWAFRLRWTRKSSTSPSLSTARQSQYLPPPIEITISSRCQ